MPATVSEKILDNVRACVRGITTENGHEFTIRDMHDQQFNAFFATDLPAAGVVALDEQPSVGSNIARECRDLTIQIDVWMEERELDQGTLKNDLERMIASVYRVMVADVSRGGWAADTTLLSITRVESEANERQAGASILFRIHYRFKYGDPTVKA